MFFRLYTLTIAALFACQSAKAKPSEKTTGEEILFQERASVLWAPAVEKEGKDHMLLVVLHGYIHSSRRDYFSKYLGVTSYVKDMDHYLLEVYGTENPEERWFWNAEDACCDFHDQKPNDVEYLSSLIQKISTERNVGPERIIVMGHSNGGFMTHRLACVDGEKTWTFAKLLPS